MAAFNEIRKGRNVNGPISVSISQSGGDARCLFWRITRNRTRVYSKCGAQLQALPHRISAILFFSIFHLKLSTTAKRRKILAITRLVWRSMEQKAPLHPPIFAHGLPISPLFFLAGLFFVRFLCVRARVFFFYSCWNSGTYSGNSKDIYK